MWQTLLAVAFWVAVWQGLAVCIGHNGLFLATPLQTVQTLWRLLPTADFWHRVGFSALRILTGFVLAVTVGLLLGACGARWRWFGTLVGPVMQLIRAMPVASFVILALLWVSGKNLSVIVSFTHVLPVVYAGTVGGIADTDPALLEMAKVYRLPLGKRLRYIWLPPWACAGKAAFRRKSSVCRTTAWAMRFTALRLPFPRRKCSPGRW